MYNGNTYDSEGLLMLTEREELLMRIAFSQGYECGHDAVLDSNYEYLKGDHLSSKWIEESIADCHIEEEINRICEET